MYAMCWCIKPRRLFNKSYMSRPICKSLHFNFLFLIFNKIVSKSQRVHEIITIKLSNVKTSLQLTCNVTLLHKHKRFTNSNSNLILCAIWNRIFAFCVKGLRIRKVFLLEIKIHTNYKYFKTFILDYFGRCYIWKIAKVKEFIPSLILR